jgi:hypothetical protein
MTVPGNWQAWPALADEVPAPPPGPGVRAPFASPPSERDRRRTWTAIGISALLLVLCCGGGLVGFGTLVVAQTRALPQEAVAVVDRYLAGLHDANFRQAYNQLCGQLRGSETLAEFTARQRNRPHVDAYTVGRARVTDSEVVVPAQVELDGQWQPRTFGLVQDQDAGGLRICSSG